MESKPDWRIGLKIQFKYRNDNWYGHTGTILDVFPDGTYGIDDKNGVCVVSVDDRHDTIVLIVAADRLVTA